MAPARVDLHPDAIAEAASAFAWYAARNRGAADRFVQELDRAVAGIAEAPERRPKDHAGFRRVVLHRFPYLVIYVMMPESVMVLAFAHARRRPGYWRSRIGR